MVARKKSISAGDNPPPRTSVSASYRGQHTASASSCTFRVRRVTSVISALIALR
jgi:hypothetical protein